jgi:hypothetical protein
MCTSKETVDNSADIKEGTEKSGQHKDQSTSIRTIVDWTIWRQASVLLFLGTAELFRLGFTVPMIHVVRYIKIHPSIHSDHGFVQTKCS